MSYHSLKNTHKKTMIPGIKTGGKEKKKYMKIKLGRDAEKGK